MHTASRTLARNLPRPDAIETGTGVPLPIPRRGFLHSDEQFLTFLRGTAILVIIFGHVGGFWAFRPYSEFLHVFVPVFFFISGAVSYCSRQRSHTVGEYLQKRVVGLLVPYYLLCLLCLSVSVGVNRSFPAFSFQRVLLWLSIRPTADAMGFPIGQVWFLHTLMIVSLVSPIYFWLYRVKPWLLLAVVCLSISLSSIQVIYDVHRYFDLAGHDLYKPLVYSSFYIGGFVYFQTCVFRKKPLLVGLIVFALILSVALAKIFRLNPDYAFHTFSPDLYYLSGSAVGLMAILIFQEQVVTVGKKVTFLAATLSFMHRHTFSLFLLHTFSIYLSETILGLTRPESYVIFYGIVKFGVVLATSCALSVPFGYLSMCLSELVSACFTRIHSFVKQWLPNRVEMRW